MAVLLEVNVLLHTHFYPQKQYILERKITTSGETGFNRLSPFNKKFSVSKTHLFSPCKLNPLPQVYALWRKSAAGDFWKHCDKMRNVSKLVIYPFVKMFSTLLTFSIRFLRCIKYRSNLLQVRKVIEQQDTWKVSKIVAFCNQ